MLQIDAACRYQIKRNERDRWQEWSARMKAEGWLGENGESEIDGKNGGQG